MGKITGICISEKRGTSKHPVDEAVIREGWENTPSLGMMQSPIR